MEVFPAHLDRTIVKTIQIISHQKYFLEGVALQNLHTTFIILRLFPTKNRFLQGVALQKLPTTFRIYPSPSEFTHHLQNLPTHLQTKLVLGPLDLFVPFFDIFSYTKNVDFDQHGTLVR